MGKHYRKKHGNRTVFGIFALLMVFFVALTLTLSVATAEEVTDMYAVTATVSGDGGTASFNGQASATVEAGASVYLTVTPKEGWYVESVADSAGNALTVSEAGGAISYTPASDGVTVAVTFAQYAVLFESADGSQSVYFKTMSEAVPLVTQDADTITLQRDVFLSSADCTSSGTYRLELNQGFVLDLNGKVLSCDRSLIRFMNSDSSISSTLTVKNGTLVAAVNSSAQHMITLMNHGALILDQVDAYCGANYTNGQIVINESEVAATSKGVSSVVITNGDGSIQINDSMLCTYGAYHTVNTNNTNEDYEKAVISLKNSHLITYGSKTVFGCADKREYTVKFLDEKSVLTSCLATNGAFNSYVNPEPYGDYTIALTSTVTEGDYTFYNYTHLLTYTVTWANYDGQILEMDTDAALGSTPEYNGQVPQKAADSEYTYVFTGWDRELTEVTGDVTYTAVFAAVPLNYRQTSIDLINETDLYKIMGRPYVTDGGLNMDFAGAAIEFEAELAGTVTMTCSAEAAVYFQIYMDGEPVKRVRVPAGDDQTVTIVDFADPGEHVIRIVRDSDASKTAQYMSVSSVDFVGKKETVKATPKQQLLIEFIGDSITAGKYTEMQYESGEAIHKATNSYAYLTAEALGADYSVVARGGCGYFRVSSCPVPAHKLYPYYNGFMDEPVAYTAERKADVVVLALGTNDNTASVTESYENGTVPFATFVEAAQYVIGQIRAMHGQNVKIVLLHNMMTSSWETELKEVAELEGVYFLQVTQNREGGNNHPSADGHKVIAQELTVFLEETVLADVRVCDENDQEGKSYPSLQSAVDALKEGQYIRLVEDTVGDAVLSGDVYLDLNGFVLTGNISGDGTLYGMDSSGDNYGLPTGRIEGTVSCNVAGNFKTSVTGTIRRYLTIVDDTGCTFHRFYLGITHMTLKPSSAGVGYKAVFYGDDMVKACLESFGYSLCLEGGEPVIAEKAADSFVSGKTVTLRIDNFDVEEYGETALSASVILKLTDGTVIESTACSMTLRSLLEQLNSEFEALTADQLTAVSAMIEKYPIIRSWDVENLL